MCKDCIKIKFLNIYVLKKVPICFGKSILRIDRSKIILSNDFIEYCLIEHIMNDSKFTFIKNKHIMGHKTKR